MRSVPRSGVEWILTGDGEPAGSRCPKALLGLAATDFMITMTLSAADATAHLIENPHLKPFLGGQQQWTRAIRPLVLVVTAAAFVITLWFNADVDAQGGAYATGVLVLITSAAIAVTLSARPPRQRAQTVGFGLVAAIFLYTTGANVVERPEGVLIATVFIAVIIGVSLISRVIRAFELRVTDVTLDARAQQFVRECARRTIRFIANEPDAGDDAEVAPLTREVLRRAEPTRPLRPHIHVG